jgi:hypothetical protein
MNEFSHSASSIIPLVEHVQIRREIEGKGRILPPVLSVYFEKPLEDHLAHLPSLDAAQLLAAGAMEMDQAIGLDVEIIGFDYQSSFASRAFPDLPCRD